MRLTQYIKESKDTFVVDTSKGFSRYQEMVDNDLFIPNSGAKTYHKNKDLITTVYLYRNDKMIGWSMLRHSKVINKQSKIYGNIDVGQIGVFVDPKYRNDKIGQQLLTKLKHNMVVPESASNKYTEKHNMRYPTYTISLNKRLDTLAKRVFNDTDDGDPVYKFRLN